MRNQAYLEIVTFKEEKYVDYSLLYQVFDSAKRKKLIYCKYHALQPNRM